MIDALEETAKVIQTPCGDGHMVWHLWGKGAPLVLLHGGSGSWTHWARNIPALSQRFRLLVADLPGLGDSDEPTVPYDSTNYPASTARLAAIVQTGVDAILGDDASFHLCGFSFGSIIGTYLAARAGQRVKTLTLAGSAAFGLPWDGLNGNLKGMTNEMTEAERIEIQRHNLSIIMMAGPVGEDAARMQLRNVERARVRSHGIGDTDTLMVALKQVTAPLNGIWGRQDIYAQPNLKRIGEIFRDQDASAIFNIIDGAGHWVMYEQSAIFDATLTEIIEQRGGS